LVAIASLAGTRPGLLRAAAINAGYVDDDDGLQQTAEQVDRLLDAGGLGDMDAAFLLEGLARGEAAHTLALGIPVTVEDERLGASGLAACAACGYTRHHHEISALLESTAS
jgi:hypothetical protein